MVWLYFMSPNIPPKSEVVVNAPEAEGLLRAMCSDHGDYYADQVMLEATLGPKLAAENDPDAILAEYGDVAKPTIARFYTNMGLFEEATRGPVQATIRGRRTAEINARAVEFADMTVEELAGDAPIDTASAEKHMLFFAVGIAKGFAARHNKATKADAQAESAVVNQFSNELVARMDPDLLCDKLILPPKDQTVDEYVLRLAQLYRPTLEALGESHISTEFIAGKLLTYRYNVYLAASFQEAIKGTAEVDMTPEEIAVMRHNNDVLAGQLQRIRKHRTSELIFPFSDVIADTDLVTHDFSDVSYNVVGEQPLALTRLVPAELAGVDKVRLPQQELSKSLTSSTVMRLNRGEFPITVDTKGELRLGMSISDNSVNLRTFFETRNMGPQYEMLRESILTARFDATLPAKIVDKIIAEEAARQASEQPAPTEQLPEESEQVPPKRAVGRLALPRIKYVQEKTMGELGKEIKQALATEQEATAKSHKPMSKHEVPGFLRDLPKGAKGPSKQALQNAREYYDDPDYVLPPGKTFVKTHARGLKGETEIVGHVVTGWAAPQAKRQTGKSANTSKKKRKK